MHGGAPFGAKILSAVRNREASASRRLLMYYSYGSFNFRFLKDFRNLMRRMNCMRRCRTHGDNIVSLFTIWYCLVILPKSATSKI